LQARRASLRREVLHTDFLTPPTLKESLHVLEKLADVKAIAQGGYPQVKLKTYNLLFVSA
jgi:RNA-binding protein YlmH